MLDSTVSVVIPTHDRAELLPRALDSVLAQSRRPEQVLVIDDGSTDDTQSLVTSRYPDVGLLSQSQKGVSAARNLGIRASTGAWIALLDSDDAWHPEKLERQFAALATSPETPLCHTEEVWIRRGRRVNPRTKHRKRGGWIYLDCLPLCAISPSSALVRRSVLEEVGNFDEELPACEDYDLWLRICSRWPVLLVDEPLVVKYGGHPDQLSATIWGLDRFRIRALEKILEHGHLAPADRRATVRVLIEKLEIFLAGARKRREGSELKGLEGSLDHWRRCMEASGE